MVRLSIQPIGLLCGIVFLSGCFKADSRPQAESGCTYNKDCGAPKICWDGICQALPCDNDGDCSGALTCQLSFCTPIYCTSNVECPNDWHCESVGECTCLASCNSKSCGDDGCGGSCGSCGSGFECSSAGDCEAQCTPACSDKECGPDGCGGECGRCTTNGYCTAYGTCSCIPECGETWECGDNGCGGDCNTCPAAAPICNTSEHLCVTECAPNCVDKECGEDGCGAECGTCPGAAPICNAQTQLCELECTPDCEGKDCGPDGCGESCGTCPQNETVCDDTSGQCVCEPQCEEGQECGDDGCEGTCGEGCDAGETCNGENACVCTPQCESKECGDDGCGGSCGTCNANSTCSPQGLCSIACDEDWDETVLLLQSDTSNETSSIIDSTANHSISEIGDVHHETDEKKFGSSALYFDDESGLEIPYSSDFNWLDGSDFTAEAWVYANAFDNEPGNNAIMAQAGNNGNWTNGVGDDCGIQWHLSHLAEYENTNEIEDHSLFLQYFGGNNDTGTTLWVADSVSGFSLETWHHVAFVADSSGVRLYVDGVKHDESTEIIGTMQGTPNLLVGGLRSSGWPRNCWNGYIEEVRISQIARYTADFSSSLPTHMFAAQACDPTPTCDENWNETVFLLQSDSSDGNTSFVDSSSSGHAINVNEDVQHDTNEQQWGTSSIYFDGEDDYLELPNNATDFDFGQGNFTIEFWARWADIDTQHTLISKRSPTIYRTYWAISKYPDDYTPGKNAKLQFAANSGGNGSSSTDNDWHLLIESNIPDNLNFTTNQWYHIALVRSGIEEEDTKFYLNGVALATNLYDDSPLVGPLQNVSWSNTIPTFEGKLHVGANVQESAAAISYGTAGISGEFEGHLEDLRITKGHARYTTDFSPPNQSFAAMACE